MSGNSIKLVITTLASLAVVVAGLVYVVNRTSDAVRRHPVDPIAANVVSPPYRAGLSLQCLRSPALREELQLDAECESALDADLEDFDRRQTEIWEQWRKAHPDKKWFRPLEPDDLKSLLIDTAAAIQRRFTERQNDRLRQVVYQQFGPSLLFLPEVQDELDMTSRQCVAFQDLYVAKIREMNRFDRGLRDAPQADRAALREQRVQLERKLEQRLWSVLRPNQQEELREILGPVLSGDDD